MLSCQLRFIISVRTYIPGQILTSELVKTSTQEPWLQLRNYCSLSSFIHTEHLYSASSRELLRGAPDSSTAKRSSLKLRKKRR